MNLLIIGGTGFMGPSTAARLQQAGHSVTVFHRGKTNPPHGTEQIIGDRQRLDEYREVLRRQSLDICS